MGKGLGYRVRTPLFAKAPETTCIRDYAYYEKHGLNDCSHAVCASDHIPVPKRNSPQGGQVHHTDVAVGESNDRRQYSAM